MQQRRPPRQTRDGAEKPFELPLRGSILSLGGVEVRVAPLERWRVDCRAELVHFVPPHTGASHPCIDLDVEWALAARRPFENAAGIAERGRQLVAVIRVEQLRARRHEDEDGPGDTGRAQLGPFFDCGDAVAPGIELLEGLGYEDGSNPVRIGLDDREEPSACYLCYRSGVVDEGFHVHFHPGLALR